jgi:hypothetical protein
MAIVVIQEFPATLEQYEAVNAELDSRNNPPEGLILHTGGQVGDGMRVIDVWESQDAYERFMNERLLPTIERVAGEDSPEAQRSPSFSMCSSLDAPMSS